MEKYGICNILGIPVGSYDWDTIIEHMCELIETPGPAMALAVNTHCANMTYKNEKHYDALKKAECVYADGKSLVWAGKILGENIPAKLTTTDVWPPLCERSVEKGWSHFLLGGPKDGLSARAAKAMQEAYPGLKIAGSHHGYFDMEDESIIETINAAEPDVLWVGMGDPRQMSWAGMHIEKLRCRLLITCGGMFKFVTGEEPRAPLSWQEAGFEWLYRMINNPKALFGRYAFGIPLFFSRIVAQRFFGHRKSL